MDKPDDLSGGISGVRGDEDRESLDPDVFLLRRMSISDTFITSKDMVVQTDLCLLDVQLIEVLRKGR